MRMYPDPAAHGAGRSLGRRAWTEFPTRAQVAPGK